MSTLLTTYPAAFSPRPPALSSLLFSWAGADGVLTARTGEAGTLTRSGSATAVDRRGTTYTAIAGVPRFECRDLDGDSTREALGLALSTDDLWWPAACLTVPPQTLTVLVDGVEGGTRTTANAGLLALGNDAQTGARVQVDSTGTSYRLTVHNGSTSQQVTVTATPTAGQRVQWRIELEDDGTNWRGRLTVRSPGGDALSAWTTAIARATAWPASARVRCNRLGSSGTQGTVWVRRVQILAGLCAIDDGALAR